MKPARGSDRELDAGSRAHYDDAAYYASLYRNRIDDVQFYVDVALKYAGPAAKSAKAGAVLEYGVGNGRIALPVARHGVSVVGIDHSRPMLADLRARLARESDDVRQRVTAHHGDMRDKRLGKSRFPLVTCPFNAALHLYTRDDVERFLAGVRAHLAPGGMFVCDLSVPMFQDLLRDPARAYKAPRFRHPTTGDIVRYVEHFDYDRARQVLFVSMEFDPIGKSGKDEKTDRAWMTPLAHRQFFPQEWEALLHYNGFEVDKVEGDFHGGPLDRTSDVMVWFARAARLEGENEVTAIARALHDVRARIDRAASACGRAPEDVKLVAVSKKKSPDAIREAYAAGQRAFGESYAQELAGKSEALADLADVEWHFIGHVQTNKAKVVAAHAHVVHAVDSAVIAHELGKRAMAAGRTALSVLLEVNVSGEAQKHGATGSEIADVMAAVRAESTLVLRGLMTMPPFGDPEAARRTFATLASLRSLHGGVSALPELSMGMSGDLEIAVECGATMVRVGTAIFGER